MLVFLFGYPATGKTYVGEVMRDELDFISYDGDVDFGTEIETHIKEGKLFSDQLRDEFVKRLISNIEKLQSKHKNVVISQTLAKHRTQKMILDKFPDAIFIRIVAPMETLVTRLKTRKHLSTLEYAEKVFQYFEKPQFDHHVLQNDGDKEKIITQLKVILKL